MSRIYFDKKSKQELITCISTRINSYHILQLVFIKKYHGYEPELSFLPIVLVDIIMSYVNDVLIFKCSLLPIQSKYNVSCFSKNTYINYVNMSFNFEIMFMLADKLRLSHCNSYQSTTIINYNAYMNKYYGYSQYIPYYGHSTTKSLIYTILNHKAYKCQIIIYKMIIDTIQKIESIH